MKVKGENFLLPSGGVADRVFEELCTGNLYKAVPRFGEFCLCCCLPLLPQLASSILAIWEQPYRDALYGLVIFHITCCISLALNEDKAFDRLRGMCHATLGTAFLRGSVTFLRGAIFPC